MINKFIINWQTCHTNIIITFWWLISIIWLWNISQTMTFNARIFIVSRGFPVQAKFIQYQWKCSLIRHFHCNLLLMYNNQYYRWAIWYQNFRTDYRFLILIYIYFLIYHKVEQFTLSQFTNFPPQLISGYIYLHVRCCILLAIFWNTFIIFIIKITLIWTSWINKVTKSHVMEVSD